MNARIRGRCPMGCGTTLFVGDGGYVTCSWHACPAPTAVADLLDDPLGSEHVVTFGECGFDVQHPLRERGADLVGCELHQHLRHLDGPPIQMGRYIVRRAGDRWTFVPLPEEAVSGPAPGGGAGPAGPRGTGGGSA